MATSPTPVVDHANFVDRIGWREMTLTTTGVDAQNELPPQSGWAAMLDPSGPTSPYPGDGVGGDGRRGFLSIRSP